MDSLGFTWTHFDSLGLTWTHLVSLRFTWIHFDSLGFTWTHFNSLGLTGSHLPWTHLDSLGPTREKGTPPVPKREKGKPAGRKREKGKPRPLQLGLDLTRQPERAHARTTRNDFPVGLTPPTSDLIRLFMKILIHLLSICWLIV